jgi:peptidyl-prolyl cis-trans isomerase SurA
MKMAISFLFSAWLIITIPAVGSAKIVDRIVAQVNDEIITLSDLDQAIKYSRPTADSTTPAEKEALRKQMLDILIDRKLAKAEAKRYGLTVPEKDLQKAIDDIKKKNGFADDAALSQALAKDGMTMEQLRQQISEQIQQDRLMALTVKDVPKVTDTEVKKFYEQNFKTPENRVHVKVITLPIPPNANADQQEAVRATAEKVLTEAQKGGDFDKLMKEYSKPIPNIPSGDLGFLRQADLDPKFFEFLTNLKPNEVVPLKTPQGFQIIKLIEIRMNQVVGLDEVRPQIIAALQHEKMMKLFSEHLKDARKRALVKVMLNPEPARKTSEASHNAP